MIFVGVGDFSFVFALLLFFQALVLCFCQDFVKNPCLGIRYYSSVLQIKGFTLMGKDSKTKDSGGKGKGKQAGGGSDGAASKGKGKAGKSDGLGTCTYVKGWFFSVFLFSFTIQVLHVFLCLFGVCGK